VVANCTFRVKGKRPYWWDPETGQTKTLTAYAPTEEGTIRIPFLLGPSGSGFVVFIHEKDFDSNRIVKVTRNDETLIQDGIALKESDKCAFDFLNDGITLAGNYVFTRADGKNVTVKSSSELESVAISGPWKLKFPDESGLKNEIVLDQLESWTQLPEKEMNYFSGTGTFSKTIVISAKSINNENKLFLDLGKVAVMAKVFVNGKDAGILWKSPYRTDITSLAHEGENKLKIEVVNLWVNRQIGDENLPEDSERNPNGTLKQNTWPDWILKDQPSPTGRQTFTTWRLWKKDDPLQESGLIGPVTLQQAKPVR
jgi:hypothetical protein